jgi:cytidine deaminase
MDRFAQLHWFNDSKEKELSEHPINSVSAALKESAIRGSRIMDALEFLRAVHAEMCALMNAARRGIPVKGCTLYVTTFPCHECARHIIAAGIDKVVYLAPYPKSLALELHSDAIALEVTNCNTNNGQVIFKPFIGLAPSNFQRYFAMLKRHDDDDNPILWEKRRAYPRCFQDSRVYMGYEITKVKLLSGRMKELKLSFIENSEGEKK